MTREMGWQIARDAVQYRVRKSAFDVRHVTRRPAGSFRTLGGVRTVIPHERGITLGCERGSLRLSVIAPDCIQVRLPPAGRLLVPFSYAVAKVTWPDAPFTFAETDRAITLHAAEVTCTVDRLTSRLTFTDQAGRVVGQDAEGIAWRGAEIRLKRALPPDALCVGLAEQPVGLDVRGHRYVFWNTSPTRYDRGTIPIYFTIPFYLTVHADYATGFFWDNPSRGWLDMGAEQPDQATFYAESGELRYYVFSGADTLAVLSRYTELTGRMPLDRCGRSAFTKAAGVTRLLNTSARSHSDSASATFPAM